ncbi:MAG: YeiH family protein [Bacteroides sp.]|nr:YeiH family protein [Bacteroides sp.]MCM1085216.1 YeiH family protein [Bacteroides sp.]
MVKLSESKGNMLHGILLIALFSCAAFYIAQFPFIQKLSFSPLIIGILLGMLYANSLRNRLPETWVPGIQFSAKQLLRLGIILYGFRLTLGDIVEVGWSALAVDAAIVAGTILLGLAFGRLLKMDRDTALLTSVGSSICGAAAVLGADATIRPKPYKTAVAVSTVVIFGTVSMFLYPFLYRNGWLGLDPQQMGLYTGATLHEVAHAVGAGNAMGGEIQDTATIVKMIRVMMLVPVLLVLAFTVRPEKDTEASKLPETGGKRKIAIPWFAFVFLLVICFNSLNLLPKVCIDYINSFDTFLLTMAMTALGTETSFDKFRKAGPRPFLLAFLLYIWLFAGGYALVRYLAPLL